jgi:hypothetical protein
VLVDKWILLVVRVKLVVQVKLVVLGAAVSGGL